MRARSHLCLRRWEVASFDTLWCTAAIFNIFAAFRKIFSVFGWDRRHFCFFFIQLFQRSARTFNASFEMLRSCLAWCTTDHWRYFQNFQNAEISSRASVTAQNFFPLFLFLCFNNALPLTSSFDMLRRPQRTHMRALQLFQHFVIFHQIWCESEQKNCLF